MSARPGFRNDKRFETRSDQRMDQLRVPPQSVEAEQAVLGGLMLDPNAYDRIADPLKQDAGELCPADHQIIGPFEGKSLAGLLSKQWRKQLSEC